MLGGYESHQWAAAPSAIAGDKVGTSSSDEATATVVKTYARASRIERTAAGDVVSSPLSTFSGKVSACKDGKDMAADGNDAVAGAAAYDPALLSSTRPSVNVVREPGETTVDTSSFPASPEGLPFNEEGVTQHVLYDGLPYVGLALRRARQRQSEAYYHFQRRIHERAEAAHALLLSANPLSLSVMASQLHMYRWRVTQAQTLTDATAILQEYVVDAANHGFRVRRRVPKPLRQSRYAHGRGTSALMRRAKEELEKLSGIKSPTEGKAHASVNARRKGTGSSADAYPDSVLVDTYRPPAGGSQEKEDMSEADEDDAEIGLPPAPPDALPRLVIVDAFTHEDLGDIARHVRFVDKEYGLEMLVVLLLPGDMEAMTESMQGAGCVVRPVHHITMEDAYAAGYDLVLAHSMDHFLVDFLTSAFVSSVGRWRNDVRSKAAVGNYMSLRSVLLGELDMTALQRLAWDDGVDDVGVLELLGAQSLAPHGRPQRYDEATRNISQQQGSATEASWATRGGSAETDKNVSKSSGESFHVTGVPRLRDRPSGLAHFGVRLPRHRRAQQELISNFSAKGDVLAGVMASARQGPCPSGSRRTERDNVAGRAGDTEDLNSDEYQGEDGEGDMGLRGHLLQDALEKELGRLLTENEGKQSSIDSLQEEVTRLQRTVAVLRRHRLGPSGPATGGANAQGSERPDSGSAAHLSKQQQIFILKERLDAANERIEATLKEGRSGRGSLTPGRRGRRGGSISRRRSRAPEIPISPYQPSNSKRSSAFLDTASSRGMGEANSLPSDTDVPLTQLELRHQEMIAAAHDAANKAAAAQKQRKDREAADKLIQSLRKELKELHTRMSDTRPGSGRTEREKQSRAEAYLSGRLQSVLEVLDAQKQHIRQLEEMSQMEARMVPLTACTQKGAKGSKGQKQKTPGQGVIPTLSIADAAGEADGGDSDSNANTHAANVRVLARTDGGARSRRTEHPRDTDRKAPKPRAGAKHVLLVKKSAVGTDEASVSKRSATGGIGAIGEVYSSSSEEEDAEDAIARRIEAAVQNAVTSLQRAHQGQLAAVAKACKNQLARIAVKLQRPPTSAYMAVVQEELARAQREQHGAWMRLRFTLNGLRSDQFDAELAKRSSSSAGTTTQPVAMPGATTSNPDATGGVTPFGLGDGAPLVSLGAVTDPKVRHMASKIAREYAAHGLRVAYLTSEQQRVERIRTALQGQPPECAAAAMPVVADVPLEQALSAHREASARVQETIDSCGSMEEYLKALQAELVAEHQLRPWCDVNCAQLLDAVHREPSPASSTEEALKTPSASCSLPSPSFMALVPGTLHLDATASSVSREQGGSLDIGHASDASSNDPQSLCLVDVDGSMRDVAEVYATLLRIMDPQNRGPVMDFSDSTSGNSSLQLVSPQTTLSADAQSMPAAPSRNPHRPHRAKAADKKADNAPEEEVSFSCHQERPGLTMKKALAQLPVQPEDVACYLGQLNSIYVSDGVYSAAQTQLYELILHAYQQHLVHPKHMAAVEYAVGLPLKDRHHSGDGGIVGKKSSELRSPTSKVLVEVLSAQSDNARAQHRQVLALMDLMRPTMPPALRMLMKGLQEVQRLLDGEESGAPSAEGFEGADAPHTSSVFLTALDTAVLGCVVDELRWRRWRQSRPPCEGNSGTSDAAAPPEAGAAPSDPIMALGRAYPQRSGEARSDTPTGDRGATLEDVQSTAFYTAFYAARERNTRDGAANESPSAPGRRCSPSSEAEDLFHLTVVPPTPGAPRNFNTFATIDERETSVSSSVARQLAAQFSKRHPHPAEGNDEAIATMLEEIYLDKSEYDTSGKSGNANAETMRNIRRELENLQTANQQRVVELMKWFASQRGSRPADSVSTSSPVSRAGAAGGRTTTSGASPPSIDLERLDFEVKSGSPAWYGMEAATRVHNILRRRAGADQIIVSGGPHGGGVGIELSRRTALPALRAAARGKVGQLDIVAAAFQSGAPNTEDEDYKRSSDEEGAVHTPGPSDSRWQSAGRSGGFSPSRVRLPPIHQQGLRGVQRQKQHRNAGLDPGLMASLGYVSPRDSLSLNAYGHMAPDGAYAYTGTNQPFYANSVLSEQVLMYRDLLKSAAGNAPPTSSTAYANGAPFCVPLSSPRRVDALGNDLHDPQCRSNFLPRPDVTAWVYGVPESYASSLVGHQQDVDPRQPPDTVLFMPRHEHSPLAEAEGRQHSHVPAAVPHALLHGRHFTTGATASGLPYSTPAALAAQRLHAMLRVSMGDLSVTTAATVAARASATRRGGALPLTQGHAYPLLPRMGVRTTTASPHSSTASSRKRTSTGASAASGSVGSTASPLLGSRGTATEGETRHPQHKFSDGDDPKTFDETQNFTEGDNS
ncbi:uncharacterized protein JKF63_07964 [Porcisia hertigi]|uniref:Uncharacterized protein n=1 Tax=Porcisia hertigi TaxID=2761500 RepID=A0A836H9K0_9TRYP|nr:hypothetical protein JKF63_07964 [Porcisia hertigi]